MRRSVDDRSPREERLRLSLEVLWYNAAREGAELQPETPSGVLRVSVYRDGLLQGTRIFAQETVRVGRDPACDLVLDSEKISRHQAIFSGGSDGRVWVSDDGSSNGTYVNGHKVGRVEVGPDDEVGFGPYAFKIKYVPRPAEAPSDPFIPVAKRPTGVDRVVEGGAARVMEVVVQRNADLVGVYVYPQGKFVAGRDPQASLVLLSPDVSRRHAIFRREGDAILVKDLGSRNGTFVNGAAIVEANLGAGDVVSIADFTLTVSLMQRHSAQEADDGGAPGREGQEALSQLAEHEPHDVVAPQWDDGSDGLRDTDGATSVVIVSVFEAGAPVKTAEFVRMPITVGRDPKCEIVLPSELVSRKHAAIDVQEGEICIRDVGSANGILVNGERVDSVRIETHDVVTIGEYELALELERRESASNRRATAPRSAQPDSDARTVVDGAGGDGEDGDLPLLEICVFKNGALLGEKRFNKGEVSIGRDESNDICLLSTYVSRHHLKLAIGEGTVLLRDCGSSNGAVVNGAPVRDCAVGPGDEIQLGDFVLRVRIVFDIDDA